MKLLSNMTRTAKFSKCKLYRYELMRRWAMPPYRTINFIGLNPSTADANHDDPTVAKLVDLGMMWGFGEMIVTNIFAFRSTDPLNMLAQTDPVGPDNNTYIRRHGLRCDRVVCMWGNHGDHRQRNLQVIAMLGSRELFCFGLNNKVACPTHPLYLKKSTQLLQWHTGA